MKSLHLTKRWVVVLCSLILMALASGPVQAQVGDGLIRVDVCTDQNANGLCDDPVDGPAPLDVAVCLNDETNCQPAPATFDNLLPGSYVPILRFTGASQGHYPTTPRTVINLAEGTEAQITLGAVYPIHPKGIAIHSGLNKVYVAFIGPVVDGDEPYPFVAVIDGETDEVLRTIPGGPDGIGRKPWGVAVSGDYVYVGSFGEGRVSVIDVNNDAVIANLKPDGDNFQPTAPAVNPMTGWVHFPDRQGGRVVIIDGTSIVASPSIDLAPLSFGPFEIAVASAGADGFSFVTMRDAIQPNPYRFATLDNGSLEVGHPEFSLPGGNSGPPHAIGLWQQPGMDEPRLFVTYADDPRPTGEPFPNPNQLAVYSFPTSKPQDLLQRNIGVEVGDYAEVGLIYDPIHNRMIGTVAGFAYDVSNGHVTACDNPEGGGLYLADFDGNVSPGPLPNKVIGNPPFIANNLQWRNPFELAINPTNGKVYVTDRCWSEFPNGGQPGGGAVLTFDGSLTPEAEVTVRKSDLPDPVAAGEGLTYAIRVDNTGSVDLHATVIDTLPPGVTPNEPIVWENVFIPVGDFWEQTFVVTVDEETSGLLTNRVEVTTEEGATDSVIEETTILSKSVAVSKLDSPDPVPAGEVLTYTILVENKGSIDLHATIVDILPLEVIPNGPTIWDNILIPAGEVLELMLNVTVDQNAAGPLINQVEVTTIEGPGDTAQATTQVANLTITKTDTPDPVLAGEVLTYTIRVDNTGSIDLHASIIDLLPPNVTADGPTSWNDVFIPVGGFWEQIFTITVDPNAVEPLTNRVKVTTLEGATGEVEIITEVIPRGIIIVDACPDQDADGNCGPGEPLPSGVQGCLRGIISGDLGCQPVRAVFTGLDPDDTLTPFLEFTAESEGHYPTTRVSPVRVGHGEEVEVTLGAVYPFHPKGVAVHEELNKIYVAFKGPKIENDGPYPFVAVIDGVSDEVLYTIPGGPDGIGRSPWGVAVSGNGQYVYVSSFRDRWISVIDPTNDTVVANISLDGSFSPTVAVVNPTNGWVHFPDYQGGRMIALDGLAIVRDTHVNIAPVSFSPFEMVVADYGSAGYSFMTMRDAIQPHRFKFATLNDTSLELTHPSLGFPDGTTGPPHAIGLWQQPGINESRLFITYADDPRPTGEPFPNPNKLAIYSFPAVNPKDVLQRKANIVVGDFAEVGLIFDPTSNQMLGTFAGFPYNSANGDVAACSSPQRGGTYGVDFDGNVSSVFAPNIVVGNPPLVSAGLDWRNPFEIAVNASNGKVYVTDRCWSDFPGGGRAGGGAVLIYARDPINVAASSTMSTLELKLPVFSSGDATGDGQIDLLDLTFIASRYGSNDPAADINGDGIVDLVDILIAERNYGPR